MYINALNSFLSSGFYFSHNVLMDALCRGKISADVPFLLGFFVLFSKICTVLQMFTCLNSPNLANITVVNVYGDRYF